MRARGMWWWLCWCVLGTGVALSVGDVSAGAVEKVEPITININQSPWFDGFRRLVEFYEKESGNAVKLNVNPYLGSLEASRNSVRANEGFAHLVVVDNNWVVEFYAGGFLTPLADLDPGFKLQAGVNTYDDTVYWDAKARTFSQKGGKLMGVPINGNVEVLFYREDLYKEKGLKVPDTWEDLLANAKALHEPRDWRLHSDHQRPEFPACLRVLQGVGSRGRPSGHRQR
jgi:multiple sugar transport system substrate-binding protein